MVVRRAPDDPSFTCHELGGETIRFELGQHREQWAVRRHGGIGSRRHQGGGAHRYVADGALAFTVLGAASFLWVITGDLFADFPSLPDALQVGPALFQVGTLVLLVQLVIGRRLPVWSPVLVGLGFGAVAASLDLLPVGALVVLVGLLPIARPTGQPSQVARPGQARTGQARTGQAKRR